MEWVTEENCVCCDSKNVKYFGMGRFPVLRFKEVFMEVPLGVLTTYFKCDNCGLIFQNPHMDAPALDEFYKSGLYRLVIANQMSKEAMDDDERRGSLQWAEYVPKGKHLDVGCSHGLMLEMTRMKGCEILGVEPNKDYVDFGVPSVRSVYDVEGEWDTITLKHVLEHVPDLKKFVARIIELMKPGGRLILEVPAEDPGGWIFRLPHLYNFTEDVIRRLFTGLEVEKYEANPHHYFIFRKVKNETD
jgi:SAM-dependent methyltransferase